MKLTCKVCKTVIQMADTEGVSAVLAAKMADHVKREHTKPVDVLATVREKVSAMLVPDLSFEEGKKIAEELCGLLNLPVPSHFQTLASASEGEK